MNAGNARTGSGYFAANFSTAAEAADYLVSEITGTTVGKGAAVRDTVVMTNVKIGKGARLNRCLVMDDLTIPDGMELGEKNAEKVLLVSKKVIDEAGRKQK